MKLRNNFGTQLLNRIDARFPNLTSFSEAVGVHYSTVYRWVRGDSMPQMSSAARICDILDCSWFELVGEDHA